MWDSWKKEITELNFKGYAVAKNIPERVSAEA